MYNRIIEKNLKRSFLKGKIIIITGARQTGKTTLSMKIMDKFPPEQVKMFNGDNPADRELLSGKSLEFLEKLIGGAKIIFIDEGQKVGTIGQTLKLLVDKYKSNKQIIVTGSSSFNLLDKTEEPLTGRKIVFHLFPLSLEEIYKKDFLKAIKNIEEHLVFGNYPEVAGKNSFSEKRKALLEISSSYLYKDVLEFQGIKKSDALVSLLKALSLQIGSEVSYTELANISGLNKKTVESYVDILEKNYIIFRLPPYAKNKRKIISKLRKIYFYDLGARNAIINNFNLLADRGDIGALWENFMAVERLKFQHYHEIYADNYFWRTYDGSEVDWVEERNGKVFGFEFKWGEKRKARESVLWKEYSSESIKTITRNNMDEFVM
ncbi:MAG: AAA family ATPase [Actinobacteria bacterium]|nr:AAA family ATPase [Actinomycetota bacterium]